MVYEVPTLAIALRAGGRATEADYLLAAAATRAETAVRLAPRSAERMAMLAYVRAAQGRREEAVRLLASANAIVWLLSDDSAKTTGHIIPVDGGLTEAFLR